MNFRFYITDLLDGNIQGTNEAALAEEISASEDYFVVDALLGEWLHQSEGRISVLEAKRYVSPALVPPGKI